MGERKSWASLYDLFQIDDGYPIWCTQVMGMLEAGFKLREISSNSPNECYAVHRSTNEIVARLNVPARVGAPRVFHVAYDLTLADKLARELPWCGCRFSYAAGNDLAYTILLTPMKCEVFTVGYAAPIETRRDAAAWLVASYPHVPVIALKAPCEPDIHPARFNLELDGDGALLTTIAKALDEQRRSESNVAD